MRRRSIVTMPSVEDNKTEKAEEVQVLDSGRRSSAIRRPEVVKRRSSRKSIQRKSSERIPDKIDQTGGQPKRRASQKSQPRVPSQEKVQSDSWHMPEPLSAPDKTEVPDRIQSFFDEAAGAISKKTDEGEFWRSINKLTTSRQLEFLQDNEIAAEIQPQDPQNVMPQEVSAFQQDGGSIGDMEENKNEEEQVAGSALVQIVRLQGYLNDLHSSLTEKNKKISTLEQEKLQALAESDKNFDALLRQTESYFSMLSLSGQTASGTGTATGTNPMVQMMMDENEKLKKTTSTQINDAKKKQEKLDKKIGKFISKVSTQTKEHVAQVEKDEALPQKKMGKKEKNAAKEEQVLDNAAVQNPQELKEQEEAEILNKRLEAQKQERESWERQNQGKEDLGKKEKKGVPVEDKAQFFGDVSKSYQVNSAPVVGYSLEPKVGKVRKHTPYGQSQSLPGDKKFEWPSDNTLVKLNFQRELYDKHKVKAICSYTKGALWSIQLFCNDPGTQSPVFGDYKQPVRSYSLEKMPENQGRALQFLVAKEGWVNAFRITDFWNAEFINIKGNYTEGVWKTQHLSKDEVIVGVHGIVHDDGNLVAFNFITMDHSGN